MKLNVLFHHPYDDPSLMPNAIAVWDEFLMESTGRDVWEAEMDHAKERMGAGSFREAVIDVPGSSVLALFEPAPPIQGSVSPKE